MDKRVAWIVPLVAACGGPSAGQPAQPAQPDKPGSTGDLFAPLFVMGATTQYDVVTASSHHDEQDPTANAQGFVHEEAKSTMTCTVRTAVDATVFRGAWLACEPELAVPVAGATPTGAYFTTEDGLWRVDKPLEEVVTADLTPATMLLAASPVAVERKHEEPDGSGGELYKVEQRPADGAWCATRITWSGDDGGVKLCFAAGKGLVGGSASFGGGSSIDATYELAAKR
jgi:hypothetical protein